MFEELTPLLKERPVTMTMTMEGDQIRVNVIPQKVASDKDDSVANATKALTLLGKPNELDAHFVTTFINYTETRADLLLGIDKFKAEAAAARKKVEDEAKKLEKEADDKLKKAKTKLDDAKKKVGEPVTKPAPSLFGGSDDDDKDEETED